jgi:hypothetical protein
VVRASSPCTGQKKKFQRKTNVKEINSRYEFVIGSIDNLNNII